MKLSVMVFCLIQRIVYCENAKPRIAIIGGGIGGATAAYTLRQLFEENTILLHIFESGDVGGRLKTVEIGGRHYEAGGSIIHPANRHMVEFLKLTGLKKCDSPSGLFGIFNGKDYPFQESSYEFVTFFRLLWRYGSDIINIRNLINETLDKFSRIYELQNKNFAFTSLDRLLSAMSQEFPNMTRTTTYDFLKTNHFGERIIKELVEAVANVNYGQTTAINSFVGSVSLAGAMPGLFSVAGGNKLIPEKLIKESSGLLIQNTVTEIQLRNDGKFNVISSSLKTSEEFKGIYDTVIIATPLIEGQITFKGFSLPIPKAYYKYHSTIATFVQGKLNLKTLGLNDEDEIDEILINNHDLFFNSVGKVYPVDYKRGENVPRVYKIFSKKLLTRTELNSLFSKIDKHEEIFWLAYPHYSVPDPLDSFLLYPNLFHISPIEWAASAMEMSAISGKNAALLAYHSWRNATTKVDPSGSFFLMHEEL